MMGKQPPLQPKLFYGRINLERRIRKNHILRRVKEAIDFDFTYDEVADRYGYNGNVSVPPPVILKMMLLLTVYNVRSERELMETLPERLDWLWFLGYDLDEEIPDHSVLSKARARWGPEAFGSFFERIVMQCVEAGLVKGEKIFVDASLVDADASNNSVVDKQTLKGMCKILEKRLDEPIDDKATPVNKRHVSSTDPDAAIVRHGSGKPKTSYKTHRAVDEQHEVITATEVTSGSVNEGQLLGQIIDAHEQNTVTEVSTVVADTRYGSNDNYLDCHDRQVKAHIPSLEQSHRGTGRQSGILSREDFKYDPQTDTFTCPAGQTLKRRKLYKKRDHYEYKAPSKVCKKCPLGNKCTRSKQGRTLKRHIRQEQLDGMLVTASSIAARRDLKTRQHLCERSFARSTRYGYKRARWRRLWRVRIQDYLVATVQNIMILVDHTRRKARSQAAVLPAPVFATGTPGGGGLFSVLDLLAPQKFCQW
jgi:transposase